MMKDFGKLSTVFLGVATTIVMVQPSANALTTNEINRIAKSITVRVESQSPGSGVIIKRSGNTYTVLTAARVVNSKQALTVVTPSGQAQAVLATDLKIIPGVDLAVFQFKSTQAYPVARLGNSDQLSGQIYVSGYPLPTAALNNTYYYFTQGVVKANALRPLKRGYAMVYTNNTQPGMSGGPILDSKGRLVGIHGMANAPTPVQRQSINPQIYAHGFNIGVPLNFFLSRASQTGLRLGLPTPPPRPTPQPTAEDYFLRGGAFLLLGNPQGALASYTQAIRLKPNFAEAYSNRQKINVWQGNYRQAIADGNRALQLKPNLGDAYLFRGVAHFKLGNLRGQLADFNKLVDLNPYFAEPYSYRSYAHYLLGNYSKALTDAEEAVKLDTQSSWAYAVRGLARSKLGQAEAAIDDGSSAIQYDPDAVEGWHVRALIYLNLKDYRNAIASTNQAIKLNPKFVDAYMTRAAARLRVRDRKGAIADLNQAIALDPKNVNVKAARRSVGGS